MFYSCPAPSKELIHAVAFCLGIWFILEVFVLWSSVLTSETTEIFDTTVLVWTPRIMSLCCPQDYRKECLGSYLCFCPEHLYDAQLLELPSYSACKLFLSSYFSKRRNKSLTSVMKTPCSGFCPSYRQLHTLSNTFIWAETPFENIIKPTWAWMQVEGFTESFLLSGSQRAASTLLTILFHVLTPPTSLPSLIVACLLYTDWKWIKDTWRITILIKVWLKNPAHYWI